MIYDAARHELTENGYAATSIEAVARQAGVSTKTLYRLIPNKAALFETMVAARLDLLSAAVKLNVIEHADIEEALGAALLACAKLALDQEVIALQRIVLQEATQFPDVAGAFYRNGIARIVAALAEWLKVQQARGLLALEDVDEAAGILIGMVAFAPQRAAIFGGLPAPSNGEIEARVRRCATLFLRGCQVGVKVHEQRDAPVKE